MALMRSSKKSRSLEPIDFCLRTAQLLVDEALDETLPDLVRMQFNAIQAKLSDLRAILKAIDDG